ncbi:hypothetical protein DSO57_1013957 [Entomophthora muscae]|uniref:Uncharacterized protein n=1 Tax=Entomophthora muscae TaxID=34485 RepID=A0ACC2S7B5_9FUNG|nr:hypothetical protein DSO57_1013957 [Entomophthora muscae]
MLLGGWLVQGQPWAGIEPAPSHQAGLVGGGDPPAPGFLLFEVNPGAGTIPVLVVAERPALGPKSNAQALVGLAGPGQAIFSCPVNPDQAHPPLSNLGSPIGDPFFNKVLWPQESQSSQSKIGDQIGKTPITPEAKPARTNGQPSQDGPPKSQITVPENPKNDHEAANQTAEPEIPSLATQIAPEECPETPACDQTPVNKNEAFDYCRPPNTPFGPVHFTEYPTNPDHKPWTLEDLQWYTYPNAPKDPYQIVCDGQAITISPLIFNRKYNNPAAYLVPMKLPPTPKPIIPTPPTSDATGQSNQFLGVLYLALTALIDSSLPAAGPWAVAGKAFPTW